MMDTYKEEGGDMDWMDGDDWDMDMGMGGGRMEIHMEENADGSNKLTIIMEGAKQLAVGAAAAVSMALFSAWTLWYQRQNMLSSI